MAEFSNASLRVEAAEKARTDFEPDTSAATTTTPTPANMEDPESGSVEHHRSHLIFKFLRRDRPLPGKWLSRWML